MVSNFPINNITSIKQNQMTGPDRKFLLGELLKSVSRSFYLSLRVLPAKLREPIGIAYLLARAADTIADTSLISPENRIELLLALRAQVTGSNHQTVGDRFATDTTIGQTDPREHMLLTMLDQVIALLDELGEQDRNIVRGVVTTLTQGMEFDLCRFPDERSGRIATLDTLSELDQYTYLVAGCVGEFWTDLSCTHITALHHWNVTEMSQCGIRFGKALQMTNILRDCAKDLRIGRCYLPTDVLDTAGLTAKDLLIPQSATAAREPLIALMHLTLEHFRAAERYTLAIPTRCVRLRLACLWPILIGLKTLERIANSDAWLEPTSIIKITRGEVYRVVLSSLPMAGSNLLARRGINRLIKTIEARWNSCPATRSRLA